MAQIKVGSTFLDGKLIANTDTATTELNGLMSAADKTKLSNIAENANNYTHPTYTYTTPIDGTGTTLTAIDLISTLTITNGHVTGGTKRNLVAGANITITPTADGDITITGSAAPYEHPTGFTNQPETALSGANVLSQITVNDNGHVTGVTSRALTAADIGAAEDDHTHGDISNAGAITSTAVTPASTDYLLLSDASASGAVKRGVLIGTGTTTYLRNNGTWGTPTNTTYSEITETEIMDGTAATLRTITGRRVKFIQDSTPRYEVGTSAPTNTNLLWIDTN